MKAPPLRAEQAHLLAAAALVAAVSFAAGTLVTGDVRLDGRHGDWRAAGEGLYKSGQAGILGAGRRVLVHFHALDGRPGTLRLIAASRRPESPVRLVTSVGTARSEYALGVEGTPLAFAIPRGTRDIDLRIEASGLFRVAQIVLHRPRSPAAQAVRSLPGLLAVGVLALAWSRMARGSAVLWALLAGVGSAALALIFVDASAALRCDPAVRDALRIGGVAILWVAGLSCAGSRSAVLAAVGGTVALLHLPTVRYGFHQDDFALARAWSPHELAATLAGGFDPTGAIASYYRPLVSVSWAVDHRLWGAWTAGYHLTNLVLHAAAAVLLVVLLRRVRLAPAAALLGGLAWAAHPVAASTVAWVSARSDSLMAVFYLSSLAAFCSANGRAAVIVLAILALGAKEMAASLPLAALLLDRMMLPREEALRRRSALWLLALVTAVYLALWTALFAGRVGAPGAARPRWAGFDAGRAGDWLRALAGLYAPLFLPPPYEVWWSTPLREWPIAHLAGATAVALGAWWVAQRGAPVGRRSATTGLVWAIVTALPLLGLSGRLDLYRVGYLVAVAVGFVVAGLVTRLQSRPAAVAALALALAAALAPLSLDAARAWGRDGFQVRMALRWKAADPSWLGQLTPEMARLFVQTLERDSHALVWAHPEAPWP